MAQLTVPEWEISEKFLKIGGPGGQNVNKVASAVQLRWNLHRSSLPRAVKERFLALFASRMTANGDVVIEASEHRSQSRNRVAARLRLASMIDAAKAVPNRRVATRPTQKARHRRLEKKKARGAVKALRARVRGDEP